MLEPLLVFWRAFALSMMPANAEGNGGYGGASNSNNSALQEARKILETSFQVILKILTII